MNIKIFFKTLFWVLLLTVVGLCTFFTVKNQDTFKLMIKGDSIYSKDYVDSEKEKSYNEGLDKGNSKEAELMAQISGYKEYIEDIKSGRKVVSIFLIDDTIYHSSITNKGEELAMPSVDSNDHAVFNGWKKNDVLLNTAQIAEENAYYFADITYKFDAVFIHNDVIIETQLVEKGQFPIPPENPTSEDGYKFIGWSQDKISTVDLSKIEMSQNMNFYSMFSNKTLNEMSFSEISNISKGGQARAFFNLGDEKEITFTHKGNTVTSSLKIIGFNHDDLSNGTGKAGITFKLVHSLDFSEISPTLSYAFYEEALNALETVYNNLPEDLRSSIKEVSKKRYISKTELGAENCKLFLLSRSEISSTSDPISDLEGETYEYYQNNELFRTDIYFLDNIGKSSFFRSTYHTENDLDGKCQVQCKGGLGFSTESDKVYMSFALCI